MATGARVREVVQEGARRLSEAGIANARHEVEWLLGHVLGLSPIELYLREELVPAATVAWVFAHLGERARGMPVQYLTGEAPFCGASFFVEPGVFIPRPETEGVVQAAVAALAALERRLGRPLRLLELGTGSGCIAVALGRALPACTIVAVEVSWSALTIARRNVARHKLGERIRLVQASWAEALQGRFDGLMANPPYVPSALVGRLPLDVRREPRLSLDGGPDGMDPLRHLLAEAPRLLEPGGVLALECGEDQVQPLTACLRPGEWIEQVTPIHDLAGRPRGVLIKRNA